MLSRSPLAITVPSAVVLLLVSAQVSWVEGAALCVSTRSHVVRLRETCKRSESSLPISIENSGRTVQIAGANLQIVSGAGSTDAPPNGLGNLIIGYNEATAGQTRTGSHNVVIG